MLAEKVFHYIQNHSLAQPGDRILIAFSGGPDSACLLHLLHKKWTDCAAVYVNHKLRGEESVREEEFVRNFCQTRGIPLFVEEIEWKRRPSNLEEAARKRRYRHLAKVALQHGFAFVATAHNKNDAAETVLQRLFRGSGPAGLAGIPPKRGIYIRPLLDCSRSEIMNYLTERNITYFVDSTNSKLDFQRNRIRQELIPYLQQHFNPAVVNALLRSSQWIGEQNEIVRELLKPYAGAISETKSGVAMDRVALLQHSVPLRKALLRLAIHLADPSAHLESRTMQKLLYAIEKQQQIELPGFLQVRVTAESISFCCKKHPGRAELDVPSDGSYSFLPASLTLIFATVEGGTVSSHQNLAFLDADKAAFPLYIRNARRGDSFQPLGMSGHKKLSDFFIDRKVPREDRKKIPLVLKDEEILWVAGHQIDHKYRVTEKTRRILRIEIRRDV